MQQETTKEQAEWLYERFRAAGQFDPAHNKELIIDYIKRSLEDRVFDTTNVKTYIGSAASLISDGVDVIRSMQLQMDKLRTEKDHYMHLALANQQLHEGMIRYYEKTREILKKYYNKYNDLRREMNEVKPPKLN